MIQTNLCRTDGRTDIHCERQKVSNVFILKLQFFLTSLDLECTSELFQPGRAASKDTVAGLGHHSVDRALKNIVKAKTRLSPNKPSCPTKFQKHMAHPSQPILELQKLSIYRLSQKKHLSLKAYKSNTKLDNIGNGTCAQ